MTLVILGCATPSLGAVWWPFFVVVFYIMAPLPTLIANRYMDQYEAGNAVKDFALFVTAVLVVSAFGLPIILARAPIAQPIIQIGACILVILGNVVVFLTTWGSFLLFNQDQSSSGFCI